MPAANLLTSNRDTRGAVGLGMHVVASDLTGRMTAVDNERALGWHYESDRRVRRVRMQAAARLSGRVKRQLQERSK